MAVSTLCQWLWCGRCPAGGRIPAFLSHEISQGLLGPTSSTVNRWKHRQMMSYHEHMLQQSQVSRSTFVAVAQSSHLDLLADLWVVGGLLKEQTEIKQYFKKVFKVYTSYSYTCLFPVSHAGFKCLIRTQACTCLNNPCSCCPSCKLPAVVTNTRPYLAGMQHVSDGPSAEVGRGDDVFLTTGVPSSHCLRCCHSDSFSHANELLWCGRLWWWVRTAEHLRGKTMGLLVRH